MGRFFGVVALTWLLPQVSLGADRLAEAKSLIAQYESAEKAFFEAPVASDAGLAELSARYEDFPCWRFLPRFVALAEAQPDDGAAFLCCDWIIERAGNVGNRDKLMFPANQKAWRMCAKYHAQGDGLPMLCLRAVQYDGAAQEEFLRDVLARPDLSRPETGFATLALAELLAHRVDDCDFREAQKALPRSNYQEYQVSREDPDRYPELDAENASKFKAESIQLFRRVLADYSDVPVTISAPGFRRLKNLGEKAGKSLHALEYLTIGSQCPNLVGEDLQGQPLDLLKYRGRVVVVTFWFTGCGPCMDLVPREQRLIEIYKDRPFALLSVCTDQSRETAQATAAEHKMNWPCWFDGENGPIAHEWNVQSWPTTYVLDPSGRIVAKHLRGEQLDAAVARLMAKRK
ncbi:MAG TPA: TlpA disulfide reductase family protein [Pirellulales bacterium]|jgi:thiol-disulfide isomerase/thioredoxin|nr:TlpA disulfide reductase family protein [Pirellulales bacterium]